MSDDQNRLRYFPISFFAMCMGLAGLTLAWEKAHHAVAVPLRPGGVLLALTALVFALLSVLYGTKLARHREAVLEELRHPVKLNFFPATSISLVLLGTASMPIAPSAALPLWMLGTAAHFAFTLYVMNVWIHHVHFEIQHINPAWFIPVVGNVLVPIAGVPLGYGDVSWFFFSVGIVFWIILFTIIIYRMLFHNPLPERLMPSLFILIAPPAVGFISYVKLTGGLDSCGRILYFIGLFLTVLLLTQWRRFARLKFFLSWWAYSFPVAAITVATMVMYEQTGTEFYRGLSYLLLALLTIVVVFLLVRTAIAVKHNAICVPE
ncbi:MAG: SLAC1 anion channel family protein [Rhodospirillales bacterium]|nr:SLAC1 anion channel family protein [Rhodospirillales bacterium]